MRSKTIWLDDDHWACLNHVPMARLPATLERCWYANCSERPERVCSLEGCYKERVARSKYCSTICKNKYARKKYRERQKLLKEDAARWEHNNL